MILLMPKIVPLYMKVSHKKKLIGEVSIKTVAFVQLLIMNVERDVQWKKQILLFCD